MNNRFNTPSFNAAPRTFEDTFKTKKRESAKVISETVKDYIDSDGKIHKNVKYVVLAPQPNPRGDYMKTPYCMKEGMDRFRMAQRSHF